MTDREIIKALECCARINRKCNECPLLNDGAVSEHCISVIRYEALGLIKRQQAEIERLKEQEENISIVCKRAEEKHHQLYEEAKEILVRQAKLEAIGEFAEKLKQREDVFCEPAGEDDEYYFKFIPIDAVDDLVKEMVGDGS